MTPYNRLIVVGSIVAVAYAAATAAAARMLGPSFGYAVFGSYLLYGALGYLGARITGRIARGAQAGFAVGVVDTTVGWLLSSTIGPGSAPREPLAVAALLVVAPLGAALVALFGALASRLLGGPRPDPA